MHAESDLLLLQPQDIISEITAAAAAASVASVAGASAASFAAASAGAVGVAASAAAGDNGAGGMYGVELAEEEYLNKFLNELRKATAQCDVGALQFLLSR